MLDGDHILRGTQTILTYDVGPASLDPAKPDQDAARKLYR